jgi:hypothetical protein
MRNVSAIERALDRHAGWVVLVVALAALLAQSARIQPWAIDDAYIYFRYADNIAAGNGPVFNPGERVEGYTSFLWILLLSLAAPLKLDHLLFAKGLGLVASIGTLVVVSRADRWLSGFTRTSAAVATLLLATSGAFSCWATGGMDVPLVGFVGTCLLAVHFRTSRRGSLGIPDRSDSLGIAAALGSALGFAMILRPEVILVGGILLLDRLARDLRTRRPTGLVFAGAMLLVYVPYWTWRYSYYGKLLPNTFYVKVGSSSAQLLRGADYLADFAWVSAPLLILAGWAVVGWARSRGAGIDTAPEDRSPPSCAVLAGVVAAHSIFVVLVGGDAMPAFRFFSAMIPALCLLAAVPLARVAWSREAGRGGSRFAVGILCLALAFNIVQLFRADAYTGMIDRSRIVEQVGREAGLWMRDHLPPDTVVALNAAGAIPFYSGLRTIDMLGLNDAHISAREMPEMGSGKAGHEKGDGAYVLSRKPDIIQFGSTWGSRAPVFVGDHELAESPDFVRDYRLEQHPLGSGQVLRFYRRVASGSR